MGDRKYGRSVEVPLNALTEVIRDTTGLGAASGLLYAGAIATVSLTAVQSRNPRRRADARRTLEILLRYHTADRKGR